MRIEITTDGIESSNELHDFVRQRLHASLDRVEVRVNAVRVLLQDINGPRGGVDQRCQMRLELDHLPTLVVEETAAELRTAIDRAAGRAAYNVTRQADRQRAARRSGRTLAARAQALTRSVG